MRAAMRQAIAESSGCAPQSVRVYLGGARIKIDGDIVRLEYTEDAVLSYLVSHGPASKADIEVVSSDAVGALRRIKKKHPSARTAYSSSGWKR